MSTVIPLSSKNRVKRFSDGFMDLIGVASLCRVNTLYVVSLAHPMDHTSKSAHKMHIVGLYILQNMHLTERGFNPSSSSQFNYG